MSKCPDCGGSLVGSSARATHATSTITALIRERGEITAADAIAATGASAKGAYNALAYLARKRVAERIGYGRYRLVAQAGGEDA